MTRIAPNPVNFGRVYGDPAEPAFITPAGVRVWMWRKGQKVRFFSAAGTQVGPEHRNVAPALCAAYAAKWIDPSAPKWLNDGCIAECSAEGKS